MKLIDKYKNLDKEKIAALKKKLTSKQGLIWISSVVGLFLFMLLVMKACEPRKGTILYGVCSAFLEHQLPYPETIEHTYVEQYSSAVRIYYSHYDAFGQYMTEYLECSFIMDQAKGLQLNAVVFNTINSVTKKEPIKNKGRLYEVEQQYIDIFNQSGSIQAIESQEPDLTLPKNNPLFL